jgi:hypothetical protein
VFELCLLIQPKWDTFDGKDAVDFLFFFGGEVM